MTRPALVVALAALVGCAGSPTAKPNAEQRTVVAEAADAKGLWLELRAETQHSRPIGHAPPVSWVPIARVVDEGTMVAPGDELVRFSEDVMREWNARDAFDMAREDLRKRGDVLRSAGDVISLQVRIRQLESRRRVLAAELASATTIDQEVVRIAELELENARTTHAAAALRRERLERIAAAGAPVSGSDLARAREEELRTRADLAAPGIALELAKLPASSSAVERIRLSIADLDAQLGATADDGLATQLRTATERQRKRELDAGRIDRRKRNFEARTKLLVDPTMRATVSGTVVLRGTDVRAGVKLPTSTNCVFVLGDEGLEAQVDVPEGMRTLAQPGAEVALIIPGAAGPVLGRIRSVAALPSDARDGRTVFHAVVALDTKPEGLRPGMVGVCRLAVGLRGSPAVLPSFCVLGDEQPEILLADGTRRRIEGFTAAGWFVALAGLAPGDRVRVPADAPPAGGVRITALVEPAAFTPIVLRSWNWEPFELLPEGSVVKAGQRIAGLVKTEYWRSPELIRADADVAIANARIDLTIGQMSAADSLAEARMNWIRSIIARDRARLEARIARNAYDAVAEARTAASLASAAVARDGAARDLESARAESAAGGISTDQLQSAQAALAITELDLDAARLDAAAAELGRDWLDMRRLDNALVTAIGDEERRRAEVLIAGETSRSTVASAAARFEGAMRGAAASLKELADEEVLAPVDGVLVYGRSWDGLPRIGRQLQTNEPFRIASGSGRRATFEIPARFYGRFVQGAHLALGIPGQVGRIDATVLSVADAFLPPRTLGDELALGRTVGSEDRIFRITVTFDPPANDPTAVPPGSSVHVDL